MLLGMMRVKITQGHKFRLLSLDVLFMLSVKQKLASTAFTFPSKSVLQ